MSVRVTTTDGSTHIFKDGDTYRFFNGQSNMIEIHGKSGRLPLAAFNGHIVRHILIGDPDNVEVQTPGRQAKLD